MVDKTRMLFDELGRMQILDGMRYYKKTKEAQSYIFQPKTIELMLNSLCSFLVVSLK